jgi:hypothetical protein
MKPEPSISNGIPGQPAGALVADKDETTGTELLMVKFTPADAILGFRTTTVACPGVVTYAAETVALSSVAEMNEVGRL